MKENEMKRRNNENNQRNEKLAYENMSQWQWPRIVAGRHRVATKSRRK
jgi:hypothetical protein